jgi:CBS domain-containing protein
MARKLIPDVIRGQRLVKLPPTATVRKAAQRMARDDVRSVLVVRGKRLLGIFTGTDLISRVVARGLDPDKTILEKVMTKNPKTITPSEGAIEALRCMQVGKCRHLPIVADGELVGIVSRRDFSGYEIDEIERQEQVWERA